jgi:hypothetical protein
MPRRSLKPRRLPAGRPRDPVTDEDCERWLAAEIADVTRRYTELRAQVQRSKTAWEITSTLAEIYLAECSFGEPIPPAMVERAFARHGIHDLPRGIVPFTSSVEVIDAGSSLRAAVRIVSKITGVSRYAMMAQRRVPELRA